MQRPKIALFGDRDSEQVRWLARTVEREGGLPGIFDIQLCGASGSRVSYGQDIVAWDGESFDDVRAVHIRCTSPNTLPTLPPVLNERTHNEWRNQFLREQELQAATYGFFDTLAARGTLVVNPLTSAYVDHNTKGQFYEKLRSWGFDTPATLTTNDPAAVRDFLDVHQEVVFKPAIGIGSTRLLSPADMTRLDELRVSPVLMQERIRGHVVRVHIVGDSVVLSLRIRAEHIDSRTATEGFDFHRLPAEEETKLVQATRRLGLHFSAWDIMVTDDGRHTYLDCNPGPFILWIGEEFVDGVLVQLARYLITYAGSGSIADAASAVTPWSPGKVS